MEAHHPPPSLSACLDRIRAWARANKWKPARLAREAGVAEKVTRGLEGPNWVPNASSIKKIELIIPANWSEGDEVEPQAKSVDDQAAA